jgi:hypothetical protein
MTDEEFQAAINRFHKNRPSVGEQIDLELKIRILAQLTKIADTLKSIDDTGEIFLRNSQDR